MSLTTTFTIVGRSDDIHKDSRSVSVAESRVAISKQQIQFPQIPTKQPQVAEIAMRRHTIEANVVSSQVISDIIPTSSLFESTEASKCTTKTYRKEYILRHH